MKEQKSSAEQINITRRKFVRNSSVAVTAAAVSPALFAGSSSAGSEVIKVGIIGCMGRGVGAAIQAMNVDPRVQVTAMAELFEERINKGLSTLKEKKPDQTKVAKENMFIGLDAYQKVIDSGIDLAIIANASRFHADHFEACVEAGVHTFVEKPACIDVPSFNQVLKATEKARAKGLSVVSGQMWRYDDKIGETVKRIHEGQIGDVLAIQLTTNRNNFGLRNRPEGMDEMTYQLFNWTHFSYLSGDFLTKSLVHHADLAFWVMKEELPVSVYGLGGRSAPYGPAHGDCYDNNSLVFEYKNREKIYAQLALQPNIYHEVSDIVLGSKGKAYLQKGVIQADSLWRYRGEATNPYQNEQNVLIKSIIAGTPVNNGVYMANAALAGAIAQIAVYTGKKMIWEEFMETGHVFGPASADISFEGTPPLQPRPDGNYDVPVPGVFKLKG